MSEIQVSLIVAMSKNRVIGLDNGLPWRLPKDLAYFKAVTMGYPIVMGRKTFDSIGRPLVGRKNIVVTRQSDWTHDGVEVADSLPYALDLGREYARDSGLAEVMLIGGASLYEQALPLVSRIYLTEVQGDVQGDAFFPEYDKSQWREMSREDLAADDRNPWDYSFVVLDREVSM